MIFQSFIVTFIWLEQFQAGENSLELSMIIKMYIHRSVHYFLAWQSQFPLNLFVFEYPASLTNE